MPNKPKLKPKAIEEPKAKPKKRKTLSASQATIIAAILGLLGVSVGAVFTYWSVQTQVYAPIQATQTAQTFFFTQTALAPTSNSQEQASPTIEAVIQNPVAETATLQPVPKVNVTLPKTSDLNLVPTMYIGYLDIKFPEVASYTANVSRKQTYLWSYYWCAKFTGTLDENLREIKFSFFIDDVEIPESNFLIFKDPSTERWYCQKWVTMLSGWDVPPPTLSVVFDISAPLSDGLTTFPIGQYEHEIVIGYVD